MTALDRRIKRIDVESFVHSPVQWPDGARPDVTVRGWTIDQCMKHPQSNPVEQEIGLTVMHQTGIDGLGRYVTENDDFCEPPETRIAKHDGETVAVVHYSHGGERTKLIFRLPNRVGAWLAEHHHRFAPDETNSQWLVAPYPPSFEFELRNPAIERTLNCGTLGYDEIRLEQSPTDILIVCCKIWMPEAWDCIIQDYLADIETCEQRPTRDGGTRTTTIKRRYSESSLTEAKARLQEVVNRIADELPVPL